MKRRDLIITVIALSAMALFATEIFREATQADDRMLDKINCDRLHEAEQNGTDLSRYSDISEIRVKCDELT